ncbi:MAG: 16S rRNA (adenine(1518)-N(6)/adenine(1519)-N(6))-dimethyltransferase RsmA [Candidatus Thermochlorobacter aerophilum]|uniref:Ribosomal RNA small subunit methyltransferase A n=1 Tax=Candidatus Thermochlorobacter aerophilus TaxID=1868324 RepID=A0A395LYV0_9BACT|nr:MAG: 16S rRNA (adenine(1518)-N(6)/adenine(1519)-N(6))-dimethyltransferase RsmA [Candidatus Thermochlorobacter aerophilum]
MHYKGRSIVAKKRLGQNFLVDENIVRKIIAFAQLKKDDHILEIGPGFGALTKELVKILPTFTAVELDRTLAAFIRAEFPQVHLIEKDILQVPLSEIAGEKKVKVLGNIPYAITTPILFKLLDERAAVHSAILMMQDEVARRLLAKPSTKEYGVLAVQLQAFAEVEYGFKVKREVFKPRPEVDSAVVRLTMRPHTGIMRETVFKTLVRTAFRMRRKTLENNLKDIFELSGVTLNLKQRAEELSVQDFIELANVIQPLSELKNSINTSQKGAASG